MHRLERSLEALAEQMRDSAPKVDDMDKIIEGLFHKWTFLEAPVVVV